MSTEPDRGPSLLRTTASGKAILDLDMLGRLSKKPRLYTGREPTFWADPYVARHVLHAHLDPDSEVASRPPAERERAVRFILGKTAVAGRPTVLDLGCGPGLYATLFAGAGCAVTGIDLSEVSIAYARKQAAHARLDISYRCEDIRFARLGGPYDLIVMIYGEFCTFSDGERAALLSRIRRALRPGGLLVFDVFTELYVDRYRTGNDWYVGKSDGFWQDTPHLVLEQTFRYPNDSTSVVRYTIVGEDGRIRQFSVWWHHFAVPEISALVKRAGFVLESLHGSVAGDTLGDDTEWIGVFARA